MLAAIEQLTSVLESNPADVVALKQLASLYWRSNQLDLAAECLDHLLAQEPDNAHIWNSRAICLTAVGRPEEAIPCFREAVRLEPANASFQQNLGRAFLEVGDLKEASEVFKQALVRDPSSIDAREGLAAAIQGLSDETAAPTTVLSPEERLDMASSLYDSHRIEEATREVDLLLEEGHVSAAALLLKGTVLALGGFHNQAQEYFWKSIELDPLSGQGYFSLLQSLKTNEIQRPLVDQMEELGSSPGATEWDKAMIHFALGMAYDRLKEYELAMLRFDSANFHAKVSLQMEFDRESLVKDVDDLIATFDEKQLSTPHAFQMDSELPILVVGMPRSGTTLTEGILAQHPRVATADELRFWGNEFARAYTSRARVIHEKEAHSLGGEYLKTLQAIGPKADRVVDKNPYNFQRVGLIASIFPNAHFIHCRRDPVDSCLSFYMTCFKSPPSYSFDKSAIVFYYRQYQRLADHWKRVFSPDRWLEVQYEELVSNSEPTICKVLEFCGLEWNDRCLQPQDSSRIITSSSHWQARQPVYRTSVERWRKYEPWLGEFRELLTP
ncbi:MAG TPA: sulfotransferase [Fimbriimonadaceae bacterium]|jgi:tetratricopeptide (TPR) repeat protein